MIYNPDGSYKRVDGNRWPIIKRNFLLLVILAISALVAWGFMGYSRDQKLDIALETLQEYCSVNKVDFYDFNSFPHTYHNPNGLSVFSFDYNRDNYLELRITVPKEPWESTNIILFRRSTPREERKK